MLDEAVEDGAQPLGYPDRSAVLGTGREAPPPEGPAEGPAPLVAGRLFEGDDNPSSPDVSIISQAMARLYFPDHDPLGTRLKFGFPPGAGGTEREIVGIVGDVRDVALGQDPGPMMYVPFAQAPLHSYTYL